MNSSSSRAQILARLRLAVPPASPLPELPVNGPWQRFADPVLRFEEVLQSVGGTLIPAASVAEANRRLLELETWTTARVRCSLVPGLGEATFDPDAVAAPHALENVDFAIFPGECGVAENGAVWVTDAVLRHRVLYFIPQHVALVLQESQIVHNLHEAYARVTVGRQPYVGWISGPSKTADIEQSLVIGAHGARSLTVFLLAD